MIRAIPSSIVGTDGQTAVVMNIDLAGAPVPDRRYIADFASLIYKENIVKFIFGQEKIGSINIRSLVVITMHWPDVRSLLQNLKSLSGPDNIIGLVNLTNKTGIMAADLRTISDEPEQTIALSANYALIAISEHAACLDFYSASAFAIANLASTQKLAVDSVVRIDLPTPYLLAIYNELVKLDNSLSLGEDGEKI